ncbi:hypothetical protein F383_37133 [Gossypium arboreum]|uniref:Uncharacterized protein n=1 Tax=Gossypium arboreum TaxID=29729 RepID=A0A0B0M745_GOSAR|nr:hypothetical protein F383_37133 [Gossypium arboreum]
MACYYKTLACQYSLIISTFVLSVWHFSALYSIVHNNAPLYQSLYWVSAK